MQNRKVYLWGGVSKISPAVIQLLTNEENDEAGSGG
jgi:hypothetical protein